MPVLELSSIHVTATATDLNLWGGSQKIQLISKRDAEPCACKIPFIDSFSDQLPSCTHSTATKAPTPRVVSWYSTAQTLCPHCQTACVAWTWVCNYGLLGSGQMKKSQEVVVRKWSRLYIAAVLQQYFISCSPDQTEIVCCSTVQQLQLASESFAFAKQLLLHSSMAACRVQFHGYQVSLPSYS